MANTITAFYTFTAGTKARASQVNTNFSNFRGDLIPVEADTSAASHNEHNLGLSTHRWLGIYGNTLDLRGATTASGLIISPDTTDTLGSFDLLHGSATIGVWGAKRWGFRTATTTSFFKYQTNEAETNGGFDIYFGSNLQGQWSHDEGLSGEVIGPANYTSTSAAAGNFLLTASTSATFSVTNTSYTTIGNFRINTRGGGQVFFNIINGYMQMTASVSGFLGVNVELLRGATTTSLSTIAQQLLVQQPSERWIRTNHFSWYDSGYSAGEVVYQLRYQGSASYGAITAFATHVGGILIKEI